MNIKKSIRDFFITTVSVLGVSRVYRTLRMGDGPLVRVLVFHDVQDEVWFRRSIECIKEKYHIVSPEDFLEGKFDATRINVLITFDDGYASWVDVCLPILQEHDAHALSFINSGLIDTYEDEVQQKQYVHDRLLLSPRMTLSWDGVRTLARAGHTIGGHTTTHARLSELQEHMQHQEIIADKARIEAMLGIPLSTFAYPFGQEKDFNKVTEAILEESGYTHAFTTEGVFATFKNKLAISRLCVEEGQSTTSITHWIEGGYDLYHKIKSLCVR